MSTDMEVDSSESEIASIALHPVSILSRSMLSKHHGTSVTRLPTFVAILLLTWSPFCSSPLCICPINILE